MAKKKEAVKKTAKKEILDTVAEDAVVEPTKPTLTPEQEAKIRDLKQQEAQKAAQKAAMVDKYTVKVTKLDDKAVIPNRIDGIAAGVELTATSMNISHGRGLNSESKYTYHMGLTFTAPEGSVGLLFPLENISDTGLTLTDSVGVIDSNFKGEIVVVFTGTKTAKHYHPGQPVVKLIFVPVLLLPFKEETSKSE